MVQYFEHNDFQGIVLNKEGLGLKILKRDANYQKNVLNYLTPLEKTDLDSPWTYLGDS
jgi:hypothetical protein